MDCPGGNDPFAQNFSRGDITVNLLEGFTAEEGHTSLEIYSCETKSACSGTRKVFDAMGNFRGDDLCTNGFLGRGCTTCADGMHRKLHEGSFVCEKCEGLSSTQFTAFLVAFVLGSLLAAYTYYKSQFPPAPLWISLGIVLGFLQAILVFSEFAVDMPDNVMAVVSATRIFEFDLDVLDYPVDCISGPSSFQRYLLKIGFPVFLFMCFSVVYALGKLPYAAARRRHGAVDSPLDLLVQGSFLQKVSRYLDKALGARVPLRTQIGWFWPTKGSGLKLTCLKGFSGLYIAVTKLSFVPFVVYQHPSGQYTLRNYYSMVKGSDEYWPVLIVGICAVTLYSIGFFVFVVYLVIIAPRRVCCDAAFHNSYRGLWAKFNPSTWWFCLILMAYGLAANLIGVVISHGRVQVMVGAILNMFYVLIVTYISPWRFLNNLFVDVIVKLGLTMYLLLMLNLEFPAQNLTEAWAIMMIMIFIAPLCVGALSLIRFAYSIAFGKLETMTQRADFAQRLHDIFKLAGSKSLQDHRAYSYTLIESDYAILDHAMDILQFSIFGLQSKNRFRHRTVPNLPFNEAAPGVLEGLLISRSLQDSKDPRVLLRRLQRIRKRDIQSDQDPEAVTAAATTSSIIRSVATSTVDQLGRLPPWAREAFESVHRDGNGGITEPEFKNMLNKSYPGNNFCHEELAALFGYFDMDGNGSISMPEFALGLTHVPQPVLPDDFVPPEEPEVVEDSKLVSLRTGESEAEAIEEDLPTSTSSEHPVKSMADSMPPQGNDSSCFYGEHDIEHRWM
eukprot:TRINITY_DN23437_c0_g2_i1.p1 TRINITY_DN23437_c0_g2~~TRINITY_DN23437_c0_g2_i1.p1  ORF type:complete len:808 (+),score=96.70 TRINITY_DN23437_c0_g2_i1:78-2426(+)